VGLDALEGNGAVGESLTASAMNTASTILKKDLRLKLASLAAIVVLTFVGGMLLGRSKSGDTKSEVAGDKSGGDKSGVDKTVGEPAKPAAAPTPAEAPAAVAQPANPPTAAEKGPRPPGTIRSRTETPPARGLIGPETLKIRPR